MKKRGFLLAGLSLLLIGFGIGNFAYAQLGADDHTLALYNFDTVSGKKVKNETGNAQLDGELFGDAKVVQGEGQYGGGLVLDGEGDYMRVEPFGNPEEGTVELWFKVPDAKPSAKSLAPGVLWTLTSAGKEYGEANDSPFIIATHTGIAHPNLWFGVWTGAWVTADSGVNAESLAGQWRHVAGTWGKRGIEIYIDGELKGTNKDFTDPLPDPAYTAWIIGSDSWKADVKGVIDGVRLSDKQRTAAELLLTLPVQPQGKLAMTWAGLKTGQASTQERGKGR
jgi:hypothetical protein